MSARDTSSSRLTEGQAGWAVVKPAAMEAWLLATAHAANREVVYIAGVWDLDNTPHTFLKQGKRTRGAPSVNHLVDGAMPILE